MLIFRIVRWLFSVGMLVLSTGLVSSQDYPSKPIRIVTTAAGGGSDFTARLIAPRLSDSLGQQVIIDNRGGSSIPIEAAAKATPDGYTLLLYNNSLWLLPFLRDNWPWDPVRDFSPITLATTSPNILVVHPSLPVKSVKELISLAKARPGDLNYGSSPAGSGTHIAGELFKSIAGVNIVWVSYKGSGPAMLALIGGEVQLMIVDAGSTMAHVKLGRLRALAVTSARPTALVPGMPTVAASVPGYDYVSRYCIFAPANTPAAIINRLNQEIVRVLNSTDLKERFFIAGSETVGTSPEELATFIKSDMAKLGKVIKDAGIRAN